MNHNTLSNYYNTMFNMSYDHKYQISELENIYPYERDIYVKLLKDRLAAEEEANKKQQQRRTKFG